MPHACPCTLDPLRVPNTGLPAAVANDGIDAGQHV